MSLFITFEGIDGSGKTTQIEILKSHYGSEDFLFTREPGGTEISEKLRRIIKNDPLDAATEAYLFAAARRELVKNVIKPRLEAGGVVVCDRYIDSSLAYQGVARGLGIKNVLRLNKLALDGLWPDITFFMDISPKLSLSRKEARDAFEATDFLNSVYNGYKLLETRYPKRIVGVDATLNEIEIHKKITAFINERRTDK
jgi:dTMP kinase